MSKAFGKLETSKLQGRKSAVASVQASKEEWKPFKWQKKVLKASKDKNVVICAGRQVGKTELAIMRAWMAAKEAPNRTIWWLSPTLRQCRRDIMPRMLRMFRNQKEFDDVTVTDMILYLKNGSRIIFLSGEQQ